MQFNRLLTAAAAIALIAGLAAPALAAPAKTPAATSAAPATAPPTASTPAAMAPAATGPKVVPAGDLVDTAKASGQFTTFLKGLDATNLTVLLKNNKGLTVFAPTDAAFAALPPGELDKLMADKPALQKLLTHHIINAMVDSSKIKGAKGPVTSVAGDKIELDGSGDMLMADNADIIQPDVMATNGILHVVDHVMMPGAAPMAAAGTATPASATAAAGLGAR